MPVQETSLIAYRAVMDSGYVGRRQKEVYAALHEHQPCTVNELWQHIGRSARNVQVNIHARMNELAEMQVVEVVSERPCRVTGRLAKVWRTTEAHPVRRQRPDRQRCMHCSGKGYIEQGRLL